MIGNAACRPPYSAVIAARFHLKCPLTAREKRLKFVRVESEDQCFVAPSKQEKVSRYRGCRL